MKMRIDEEYIRESSRAFYEQMPADLRRLILEKMTIEERLAGLTTEQLLAALTPAQLLAALTPAQLLFGLTAAQMQILRLLLKARQADAKPE
jgi:hypothetical protein